MGRGWREMSPSGVAVRLRATLRALPPQPAPLSGEGDISLAIYITWRLHLLESGAYECCLRGQGDLGLQPCNSHLLTGGSHLALWVSATPSEVWTTQ